MDTMTGQELVDNSGIKNTSDFETFDFAVPINADGSYPHDGLAIAVYRKGRCQCEIVSYATLIEMAEARKAVAS